MKVICDVIFGESLHAQEIQFACSFECLNRPRFGENGYGKPNFDNVHNLIRPSLFEPLTSGHDSSDNYSRESDSASEDVDYDVNQ